MGEESQQLLQYSRPLVEESQHSYYNTPDHWQRKASTDIQYSRPLVEESQHSYYNTQDHWQRKASTVITILQTIGRGKPAQLLQYSRLNGWGKPAINTIPQTIGRGKPAQILQYSRPLVEESQHSYCNTPDHWQRKASSYYNTPDHWQRKASTVITILQTIGRGKPAQLLQCSRLNG